MPPRKPIPKPKGQEGMKKAMQLKPWKFAQLTGHLRQLAREYLDETKIWSQQSQQALQIVHDKAVEDYPFFGQYYEDAWPIERYLRKHLGYTTWAHRHSKRARGLAHHETRRAQDNVAAIQYADKSQQAEMSGNGSQEYSASSRKVDLPLILNTQDGQRSEIAAVDPFQERIRSHHASPLPASIASSKTMASRTSSPTSTAVHDSFVLFLHSCTPSLVPYTTAFEQLAGITTECGVRMLLSWCEQDLDALLEYDMQLERAALRDVRAALTNLREYGDGEF